MGIQRWLGLLGALGLLLCLVGCERDAGNLIYEVVFPSGFSRDCYTWDKTAPVEGTGYSLRRAEGDPGYLQVLDEAGEVLAEYPGQKGKILRGEAAEDGKLWICLENWETPHYNGYRGGYREKGLMGSSLLLADVDTGDVLGSWALGKGELFLTVTGGTCYFYHPGEESREEWFGLVHRPEKQAAIYARSLEDWDVTEVVWELDFVEWPDTGKSEGSPSEKRVRFLLREEGAVTIVWEEDEEEIRRTEIPLEK